jgi:hypothetical protein
MPVVTSPDFLKIIVEPGTTSEEIIYVTAYSAAATTATVSRAQEGTTGVTHSGKAWVHGPTALNFSGASSVAGVYGDGSDGSPTFDGTTTVLGVAPASNTYTLARDLFLAGGATINSGVTIITNDFRIFCSGTLINNGTIKWNGNPGSGATGGTPLSGASGSITSGNVSRSGGTGTTGAGGAGSAPSVPSLGGSGGTGGAGSGGGGGARGNVTGPTAAQSNLRFGPAVPAGMLFSLGGTTLIYAGAGGGAGGGDSTNAGGGGGGGGGCVVIAAKSFSGTGAVQARGGAGAAGVAGNAGGGGGGGGGWVAVISVSVVSGSISGQTCDTAGGAGGAGVGTGSSGSTGSNGTVILIPG